MRIAPLLSNIKKYIDIEFSEKELELLIEAIPTKYYEKSSILLKEGEISTKSFFIIKGCVRLYYNVDGVEKTAYFYAENQFVTAFESYTKKTPSTYYFECIEDCTLAILSYDMEQLLFQKFPKLDILSRLILEEELSIYQNIVATFITLSPQERYLNLVKNHTDLLNRIPQYHLASYLGVSPESLSRIRKRISNN